MLLFLFSIALHIIDDHHDLRRSGMEWNGLEWNGYHRWRTDEVHGEVQVRTVDPADTLMGMDRDRGIKVDQEDLVEVVVVGGRAGWSGWGLVSPDILVLTGPARRNGRLMCKCFDVCGG